jgi:hypothetical protein
MPLQMEQVDVFRERLVCSCGEAMKCTHAKMSHPPRFVHECPKCGETETKGQRYPKLVYLKKRKQHHDQDKADKQEE